MINLTPELHSKISMVLGRELTLSEGGSAASFDDFSTSELADIRLLEGKSGILAVAYIRFKLAGKVALDTVVSYYASVIQQGISLEDWKRGNEKMLIRS